MDLQVRDTYETHSGRALDRCAPVVALRDELTALFR